MRSLRGGHALHEDRCGAPPLPAPQLALPSVLIATNFAVQPCPAPLLSPPHLPL